MRNRKWKIAIGIGAAALVAGGVAGVAGIAGADPSTKATDVVDGFGNINDDFNDHEREAGVLCDGCENSSGTDLVTMWQSILAADGYLTAEQIDGHFGPDTAAATAGWKEYNGLEPTGEVDQSAWATADDNLKVVSEGDYTDIDYVSPEDGGTVGFARVVEGKGNYKLLNVVDLEGTELENTNQASIELFDATITLEKA